MKELDNVEKRITSILKQIIDDANSARDQDIDKNKWWTKKIKYALCQLGQKRNYRVNANRCEAADDNIEWLFDLIWWAGSNDKFEEIILAMECEWSLAEDEIWWDFDKLLVVRSKYRVFIFNRSNNDKVKNMIDQFKETIKIFKITQSGDRYLFAGYSLREGKFIFDHLVK